MPGCYLKAGRGYRPDSAHAGSPGQSPLSFPHSRRVPPGALRHITPAALAKPCEPSRLTRLTTQQMAQALQHPFQGRPDQGEAAAESRGHAAPEQTPQHVSSNGVHHTRGLGFVGAQPFRTQGVKMPSNQSSKEMRQAGTTRAQTALLHVRLLKKRSEQQSVPEPAAILVHGILKEVQMQQDSALSLPRLQAAEKQSLQLTQPS